MLCISWITKALVLLTSWFSPPPPTEQIFQNIRQEYSRIQRRRQLEGAFNQTEACSSSDVPSPSSSLNAPSSPPGRWICNWLCVPMGQGSTVPVLQGYNPAWCSVLPGQTCLHQKKWDPRWKCCEISAGLRTLRTGPADSWYRMMLLAFTTRGHPLRTT